ncbi:hypothetical protein IMSHALPRED_005632 [Imshaugia aleurites]|uniref:Heterokaryon incompatibility domain-containing protein n=1 Tax=Imshaugia aleurites TaxID=172621 RepID=A0A8H3IBR7_9LECA|nr:hypothetical protein IMSHALPRED_005632 [Imshaugia aleurites]
MDHIPLPLDPILPLTEVPYLCEEPYDTGIPFLEYPRRKDRPWMTPSFGEASFSNHEVLFPTPTRDLERFFQVWLFFGLLAELLAGLFDHESFVSESEQDGNPVISTKQLQSVTEQRFALVKSLEKSTQKGIYLHAVQCIDLALRTLPIAASDFNPAVRNSIASVAEFLGSAIDKAHLGTFPDAVRCRRPFLRYFYTEDMKAAMVAANWCPNDITRITNKYSSTQMLYFFSKMKKPAGVASHCYCNTTFCLAHSISLSQHTTRHCEACTDENTCDDISIDHRPVVNILRSGALPLLRITSKEDESSRANVDLSNSGTDEIPYVAISHVWADGLGNRSANSLPNCQLARLGNMLDQFSEDGKRPLVWLDTLCCPVDLEAKLMALSQMRRTYAKAEKTLILDSTLYNCEGRNLSAAELHARILTSGWMRRLWTLQEGALASHPLVQFKDGPLSLPTIYGRLKKLHDENLIYRRLTQDMFQETRQLHLANYEFPKGVPDLSLLDRALSHRNTTVASDEAPCIATLINLDVNEILPLSDEDRMCKVWDLLAAANSGSLPCKMIFLEGPKLKRRGYRWAPSTLLPPGERFHSVQIRIARWRGPQGKPTPQGLVAEYPGYRFRPCSGLSPCPVWDVLLKIRQVRFIFKDQTRGIWCQLMYKSTSEKLDTGLSPSEIMQTPFVDLVAKFDLAVILADEPSDKPSVYLEETYREGILVTVKEEKGDIIYASLGEGVLLTPLSPKDTTVYDAAERLMRKFRSWELQDSEGLELAEQLSEERISKLRAKCKGMTRELLAEEPGLEEAVLGMVGEGGEGWHLWVLVASWFGHVGEGWRVEKGKMWCVD